MALLALEDGRVFEGRPFGAEGQVCAEVVFNTGMTGYQEVLTDPSYAGQIVCMTYPHIGNYGVNSEDVESLRPWVTGFVVRELSQNFSNWRGRLTLDQYLKKYGIVGICEVDTRALTRHIREQGAMRGALSSDESDPQELIERARRAPTISEFDHVRSVTCTQPYEWNEPLPREWYGPQEAKDLHIVAVDYGIKRNILRHLRSRATKVTVVPSYWSAEQILQLKPDGIFLSNGPGDPAILKDAIRTVRQLIKSERCPIFGICLGHQILGLALGARAYKLKFGHRGANQPVKNLLTERIEITTHNHGFALADLPKELELTHINLNDHSIEGFRHKKLPIFAVQYHPEAAPGPHDSHNLFEQFIELIGSPSPQPSPWKGEGS
ncbi:MAG: glutamine-hydrolyzing carbamoyl-phosphate synthase small subunit [Candidatus Bipolaricaulota bacterium]|nr:glutamine-hydrolyzing carbamoyl-phosphate synthase small subunit [Candidatus Bipolaricaulota bacterium]MDW8110806.1 glutamine-hydrolyzing carbamoyl-phosphate synthase small subunit [Candidatus Bipolaricaulota bacterium]